ncbi:MAG TPA: riboflavin synthase [Candidatus Paceibacterota bacterium]|nr:riboflavin synthase [Candidatus Paceibacterota bacterium]
MFTGIITHTGTVVDKKRNTLAIYAGRDILRALKKGGSIAVDGVCLTVTAKNASSFSADVMSETFKRTDFSSLTAKSIVNLELPATPRTFLSGHIVEGHIDGVGTVKAIKKDGTQFTLSISVPRELSRYISPKGSVTVNGVSLTVISARPGSFSVGIIPHTWESTAFHTLKPSGPVNIEVDILAKYVERFFRIKKI